MALTALRPFVRLSRRLERQVVTPVPPQPVPPAATPAPAPHAVPVAEEHRPAPAPAPAPRVPDPAPPAEVEVDDDAESTSLAAEPEQFQSVDASVVPVPIESLNRLVLAVDELGSEMTHVRQAIRELTAALSDSQANFARMLSSVQVGASVPDAPDPLAAVTGPYVSGEPTPTPFAAEPTPFAAQPASPAPAPPPVATYEPPIAPTPAVASVAVPMPAPTMPAPTPDYAHGLASEHGNGLAGPEHANNFGDLPIVSTGAVLVVIGPITSLDELDDAVEHIRRINGVESVSVTSFEGPHVVLTADLSRALPLASLLRNGLGREVASCRLVDGRIVVDFGEAGPRA